MIFKPIFYGGAEWPATVTTVASTRKPNGKPGKPAALASRQPTDPPAAYNALKGVYGTTKAPVARNGFDII